MYKLDLYYNIGDLIVDQNWMINMCVWKKSTPERGDITLVVSKMVHHEYGFTRRVEVIANCQL